jgi:hypothetical protein
LPNTIEGDSGLDEVSIYAKFDIASCEQLGRIARLARHSYTVVAVKFASPGAAEPHSGRGRPSSAVLAFEYGLPSPQPRPLRSLAGQSALLPASSLRFFPPIVVSVVPR